MQYSLYACLIGFLLDLLIGDPQWFRWHPIRLIGQWIDTCEKIVRKCFGTKDKQLFVAGIVLAVMVMVVSTGIPLLLLIVCYRIHVLLGIGIESILCYFVYATKSLKTESMKVYEALETKDIQESRRAVSMIVGRDVDRLDETGVAKAAVETVAENTSDGVIAPIFYTMLGGAVAGFLYKSINTMDSMIGYKNEKYMYFGRFAAKLDDVVNFIPARVSAFLMLLAAAISPEMDAKEAWHIYKRDRKKSSSPNAGQTEAVCAGALHIQILGPAYYFGVLHEKPSIGEALKPVEPLTIKKVNQLMYRTAWLAVFLFSFIKWGVICLF